METLAFKDVEFKEHSVENFEMQKMFHAATEKLVNSLLCVVLEPETPASLSVTLDGVFLCCSHFPNNHSEA